PFVAPTSCRTARPTAGSINFMPPHWSERLLEFDRLREILLTYCGSDLGRHRVTTLHPVTDLDWIRQQHELAEEVRQFLEAGRALEFHGLTDTRQLRKRGGSGGAALEMGELQEVLGSADRADEWLSTPQNPPASLERGWPAVRQLSERLADF